MTDSNFHACDESNVTSNVTDDELSKTFLIFGVTGMDGSTMCDFLLEKGYYNIHGTMRRSATFNTQNIDHIFENKMNIKDNEVNKLRDLLFIFTDKNIDYFKYYSL